MTWLRFLCALAALSAPEALHAVVASPQLLLVATRSRAVLCNPGSGCSGGVCVNAPSSSCNRDDECPGCLVVENEDVAMCQPVTDDDGPACLWSLFFDGSAAGLDAPIRALDVLPDGSLLMRAAADNSIPDIAGVNRKDLVRFVPTDESGRPDTGELPYLRGEWRLFLDGDAVERNGGARLMEAIQLLPDFCRDVNGDAVVEPQECDLLFTPFSAGELAGMNIAIEDVIRCRPTYLSEGRTVEACTYAMFYDASEVNDPVAGDGVSAGATGSWTHGGTTSLALVDLDAGALHGTLLFSAGNEATLPAHQPSRDLLASRGSMGPAGTCTDAIGRRCLDDTDCDAAPCRDFLNPQTDVDTEVWFDGSRALGGEMLQAIAVVGDGDGDAVPDPIDNCPDVANPATCSVSGTACAGRHDCSDGERCLQADRDADGVGDACDRCQERNDGDCFCGDGITDPPAEQCDLGTPDRDGYNGLPMSPCDAECRIVGRCTRSGAACTEAAECAEHASGEGCCGNGTLDRFAQVNDEDCDDANAVADDGCDNSCRETAGSVPLPRECEGLIGPRIVPTFVRTLRFQKQRRQVPADSEPNNYSKWSTRGVLRLVPGIELDPDPQTAAIMFNQGEQRCDAGDNAGASCTAAADCPAGRCTGTLFRAILPPESFVQAGRRHDRPRWSFKNRNGTVPGAPGWTKGRFSQRLATIRRPLNEVRFMLQGRGDRLDPQWTLHLDPTALGGPPTRVRQTIVVGDLCTTQALVCEGNRAGTTLQCFSKFE